MSPNLKPKKGNIIKIPDFVLEEEKTTKSPQKLNMNNKMLSTNQRNSDLNSPELLPEEHKILQKI